MKPVIREILRMSVYQILYMERVPDSAVCNEAVKLAKKRKFQGLSGFVNGVLRTVSREKEKLVWKDASERYSIPRWMLSMWEEMYGKETSEAIAASFLEERPLTVRFNESISPAEKRSRVERSWHYGGGVRDISGDRFDPWLRLLRPSRARSRKERSQSRIQAPPLRHRWHLLPGRLSFLTCAELPEERPCMRQIS